jgi:hypothetical protein
MLWAVSGLPLLSSTTVRIAVTGPASEISSLLTVTPKKLRWTSTNHRGALARTIGIGSATASTTVWSSSELAEALVQAWPVGRVVAIIDPAVETSDVDTLWLEELVDPPHELLQRHCCILVSFFHGDHADIYGERAVSSCLADLTHAAETGSRKSQVSDEPM